MKYIEYGMFCLVTDQALIIYISRGLLNSLTEAQDVMDTIAIHNGRLNHRVIINTYAVIDGRYHCPVC